MKLIMITMLALITFSMNAHAGEEVDVQGILAIAKMTGACGIMDSMIKLQTSTKMPGGDEFVTRFWEVEAARLGMTVQEMSDQCDKATISYNELWSFAENSN